MKAKDLKLLRKNLTRVNKLDYAPLTGVPSEAQVITLDNSNEPLSLTFSHGKSLSDHQLQICLDLFERNMGDFYKNSSWGLDLKEKRIELTHSSARFLLLHSQSDVFVGFVHFRFEYDDDEQPTEAVLYVYEIQVVESFQRKGLGKKLMGLAEQIATAAKMTKVLLTVFKKNEAAMHFYKDLNYSIDQSSPSNYNEPADYEILSKVISLPATK